MTQVSSSPQTAGCCHRCCHSIHCCHRCCHSIHCCHRCCHSSHCCHRCCHSSHCCHRCYSSHCCHRCYHIQSCDDGDGEICGACGDSDSSHHRQSCSSPRSLNHSSLQSWSHSSPQNPDCSRKRQEGT
uniref:keratin-associated protein 5-4-like n=1 Tax=Myodes glareolus TaxID=447135 RepID=UPI0020212C4B|nr:keratin-associated protein 5-4-like [Myodes glareolus]